MVQEARRWVHFSVSLAIVARCRLKALPSCLPLKAYGAFGRTRLFRTHVRRAVWLGCFGDRTKSVSPLPDRVGRYRCPSGAHPFEDGPFGESCDYSGIGAGEFTATLRAATGSCSEPFSSGLVDCWLVTLRGARETARPGLFGESFCFDGCSASP